MNLVFLGPPGVGKGSLAVRIAKDYGLLHISTGEMLRAEISAGTHTGKLAEKYINDGNLMPDSLIIEMLLSKLQHSTAKQGYILDGFPRTLNQAQELDKFVQIDAAINLDAPEAVLLKRISHRRICPVCGKGYISYMMSSNLCEQCGVEVIMRDDDKEEVVKARLVEYHTKTEPIIDYYRSTGKLISVDGDDTMEGVAAKVEEILEDLKLANN
ncbi:MAG: adenylate kinase [Clostridiales bacterium]|nr:adenylate kinase [Clostridiales bacterium]